MKQAAVEHARHLILARARAARKNGTQPATSRLDTHPDAERYDGMAYAYRHAADILATAIRENQDTWATRRAEARQELLDNIRMWADTHHLDPSADDPTLTWDSPVPLLHEWAIDHGLFRKLTPTPNTGDEE